MNNLSIISILISIGALGVSVFTLWFTNLRRGQVLLSQPTIVYFGWDKGKTDLPKIMFRSALFCTAKRGVIIESMYLSVNNRDAENIFSFWGYDDGKGMVRGSGLFVGDNGHVAYHHFNPARDDQSFDYCIGEYKIEVWARLFGDDADIKLGSYLLKVDDDILAMGLRSAKDGILYDWLPQNGPTLQFLETDKKLVL